MSSSALLKIEAKSSSSVRSYSAIPDAIEIRSVRGTESPLVFIPNVEKLQSKLSKKESVTKNH